MVIENVCLSGCENRLCNGRVREGVRSISQASNEAPVIPCGVEPPGSDMNSPDR